MKLKVRYLDNYNKEWGVLSSTEGNSGYDIRAAIPNKITLMPNERRVIPNGIMLELTESGKYTVVKDGVQYETDELVDKCVEIQIRPRSGLAAKKGITVVNAPGTVDENYRGEVMTILLNTGTEPFEINPGDRISQIVVCPIYKPTVEEVITVTDTDRGANGFGSTGV